MARQLNLRQQHFSDSLLIPILTSSELDSHFQYEAVVILGLIGEDANVALPHLEIIEKFEEDITDKARLHGNLKVILEVGEAIEVSPERDRKAAVDPLMTQIQQSLQGMIDRLAKESPLL